MTIIIKCITWHLLSARHWTKPLGILTHWIPQKTLWGNKHHLKSCPVEKETYNRIVGWVNYPDSSCSGIPRSRAGTQPQSRLLGPAAWVPIVWWSRWPVVMLFRSEGTPATLRPNRELGVLSSGSINNEYTRKIPTNSFCHLSSGDTESLFTPKRPAVGEVGKQLADVSCSNQKCISCETPG